MVKISGENCLYPPDWEECQERSRKQQKLQEQSRTMYGGENNSHLQADFWAQFLNFQQPAMQSMMTAYMDQSKKMFQQMQDQLQNQTRNMFTGFQYDNSQGKTEK